jgi:hypothetical protein
LQERDLINQTPPRTFTLLNEDEVFSLFMGDEALFFSGFVKKPLFRLWETNTLLGASENIMQCSML